MGGYLAMRIMDGAMDYVQITTLYPQFKEEIDSILIEKGRQDLIVEG